MHYSNMSNSTTEEPTFNNEELRAKVKLADPMVREYILALQKENVRIQKLRATEDAKNKSEKNSLKEVIAIRESELKERPVITVVIDSR